MEIRICRDAAALGQSAAAYAAQSLREAISARGTARLALSTGASQFETLAALIGQAVDWRRVEAFHLDEYAGIDPRHPASFRKYLRERFVSHVPLKAMHYVDGTEENRLGLSALLRETEIDLGLIGIGENAHIAFNDPPADFDVEEPYIIVTLDEACKAQQCREGWFKALSDVPERAVSMSVRQIMRCRRIVSCVPHGVKAGAVERTLTTPVSREVPATILREHPDIELYLDAGSAGKIAPGILW